MKKPFLEMIKIYIIGVVHINTSLLFLMFTLLIGKM